MKPLLSRSKKTQYYIFCGEQLNKLCLNTGSLTLHLSVSHVSHTFCKDSDEPCWKYVKAQSKVKFYSEYWTLWKIQQTPDKHRSMYALRRQIAKMNWAEETWITMWVSSSIHFNTSQSNGFLVLQLVQATTGNNLLCTQLIVSIYGWKSFLETGF